MNLSCSLFFLLSLFYYQRTSFLFCVLSIYLIVLSIHSYTYIRAFFHFVLPLCVSLLSSLLSSVSLSSFPVNGRGLCGGAPLSFEAEAGERMAGAERTERGTDVRAGACVCDRPVRQSRTTLF